jgi:UDP-N-acetyl-D-glucosamine 4,6-dehydratase
VPKFKKLIEENKPLTVTHPEITRFFMLIPEACQLVLQAGSLAKSGEIFILDMGEPVKIVDLAKKMLKLYGKDENNIKFIGLRPGEKLYEELLIDEADKKTQYKDIFIAKPTFYDMEKLKTQIEKLLKLNKKEDIINMLKEIVKEYNNKD